MTRQCFVLNENTLGYSIPGHPYPNAFGILHASILRGAPFDRLAGQTFITPSDTLRPATVEDFDAYRIRPEGHITP